MKDYLLPSNIFLKSSLLRAAVSPPDVAVEAVFSDFFCNTLGVKDNFVRAWSRLKYI